VPRHNNMTAIGTATDIKRFAPTTADKQRDFFRGETPDIVWAAWCDRAAAGRICQAESGYYKGGMVNMDLPPRSVRLSASSAMARPICS